MIELPIEEKQNRTVRSFSLKPENIQKVERYAELKQISASKVVDVLIDHFLTKVLAQEERES